MLSISQQLAQNPGPAARLGLLVKKYSTACPWSDVDAESRLQGLGGLSRGKPLPPRLPHLSLPAEREGLIQAIHRIGPSSKWGIHPEISSKYME